jgi:hypothetical protein
MMEERGIVVKITCRSYVAVTPDGDFREVPLPQSGMVRIGQEISLSSRKKSLPYLRYFMAAASFLVIMMTGQLYMASTPQAAAYMTVDINPSIELAVSEKGVVLSGSGLNSDGERILSEVKVKGCNLDQAVGLIVTQAIADNYMTKSDENVILTTLTVAEGSDPLVDLEFVYKAIKTSMDSGGIASEVIIETVNPEMRREAAASGISAGRLLLQKKTDQKSMSVNANEISTMNLDRIERDNKLSITEMLGGGNDDGREYNLDKGEGAGIIKQGIYAERNSANIKIKSRPESVQGSESNINGDKNQNKNEGKKNANENNARK